MSQTWVALRTEIAGLMRAQADALDELDRVKRQARIDRDRWLGDVLDIVDAAELAAVRLRDPEAKEVFTAMAAKVGLVLQNAGLQAIAFERGSEPPLGEMDVLGTVEDPDLPELAVVRTVRRGLKDGDRVIRKAGVEVSRARRDAEGKR